MTSPPIASAGPGDPEYLDISKSVSTEDLSPGETFTYTIAVQCSQTDCQNARVSDLLPAEMAGFPIQAFSATPGEAEVPRAIAWNVDGLSQPDTPSAVTADTELVVDFTDGVGGNLLVAGDGLTLLVTLQVPGDYPPGSSGDIVNTVSATADNAAPVNDSAVVRISSEIVVGVDATKTWEPASAPLNPGASSRVGLGGTNTSNVPVEALTIQEPQDAPDGAVSLDEAANPFAVADFDGFANVDLPNGCATTQVDAYVFDGGQWAWQVGTPTTPGALALPSGVPNDAVGGIRVSCTDAVGVDGTLSFDVNLLQKDLAVGVYSVDNTAEASVIPADGTPVTAVAGAVHEIAPLEGGVDAAKNIQPETIAAGGSSNASISGTVTGNTTSELRLEDRGFFTDEITFGGFDSAIAWPSGATAAQVVYYDLAGDELETTTFGDGAVPADPSGAISGFDLVFTGTIPAGQTATAPFGIDTTEAATGGAADLTTTNTVVASIIDQLGETRSATAEDTLRIVEPGVEVAFDKDIRPGDAVDVGETATTALTATADALTDTSTVHDIVIEDSATTNADFWNAFDLDSLPSTQLPPDTSLTIELLAGAPPAWVTIQVWDAQPDASAVGLTRFQLTAAALDAGLTDLTSVQGIRFGYHNDDGFPSTQVVAPAFTSTARATLRDGSGYTSSGDPVAYGNTATAEATGESDGGTPLDDAGEGSSEASIVSSGGSGLVDIDKAWDRDTVVAQSGDTARTDLTWSVAAHTSPVRFFDVPGFFLSDVAFSTYDAFNLVQIDPIPASEEPYTNGWFLKYDTIRNVELYNSQTDSWEDVAEPAGGWIQDGAFVGYTLTDDEQQTTTSVAFGLVENRAPRVAAVENASDPFAPRPGSGVTAGSNRVFTLAWQLRDTKRSDGSYVTGHTNYNVAGEANEGVVENFVEFRGSSNAGVASLLVGDTIEIIDGTPGVIVDKAVTADPTLPGGRVYTPADGAPGAEYPTATWTVEARNASLSRAQQVRVTDPSTCPDTDLSTCQLRPADDDPFTADTDWLEPAAGANPLNHFDLTGLSFTAADADEVDLDGSTVWLLRYDGDDYSTEELTVPDAVALSASELADVAGISVTYQGAEASAGAGTISQTNRLTMTLETRLRAAVRSTGESTHLMAGETVDVDNRAFAQSYDEITAEGAQTGDNATAGVVLTGGDVAVTPGKAIAPSSVIPPTADDTLTVTLSAASGTSPLNTLSPSTVVIEDQADSVEFWNTFDFAGLGAVTLPDGADRVQVDVYTASTWVLGTPTATATVPVDSSQYGDVQGIRFTFTRDDGEYFSTTVPSSSYTASGAFDVTIRDEYRDGSGEVVYSGSIENTQTSQARRADGNDTELVDASAEVTLSEGTFELAVNKLTNNGNRFAAAGDQVPFTLTFTNEGTGFLTLDNLADQLPPELRFTGESSFTATAEADGLLSSDVALAVSDDGRTLRFTWPDDGNTMLPDETFTIDFTAELLPGLSADGRATNTMVVGTDEPLARCGNIDPSLPVTDDWQGDDSTCGTTDYVQTQVGNNMYVRKGVVGSVAGASVPGDADRTCTPSLTALDGAGYYPASCVANSTVGGTDTWLLHTVNAGTTDIETIVVADQLPVAGDRLLIGNADRGSTYRPQLVEGSIQVTSEGTGPTTLTIQVTTSPDVCVASWGSMNDPAVADDEVCTQSGETWVDHDDFTGEWSAIAGIRVIADYDTTTPMGPGDGLDVTFQTTNLVTDDDDGGASLTVPADDQFAYNQFGMRWTDVSGTVERRAPGTVGVHLLTASTEVAKDVDGAAQDHAPDVFEASVTCTVDGTVVDMGDDGLFTLTRQDDGSYEPVTIRGIPFAVAPGTVQADPATDGTTECVIVEVGETGSYGEVSRDSDPADGTVVLVVADDPNAASPELPAAQIVTLTNSYEFGELSVTKQIESDTEEPGDFYGPFTFTLTCVAPNGEPVIIGDATGEVSFMLHDGEKWTAPETTIPANSDCTITESDSDDADGVTFGGDGVTLAELGTATVRPQPGGSEVSVANRFDSADFTLTKQVDGDGADRYGQGDFIFSARCTYVPAGADDAVPALTDDGIVVRPGQSYTSRKLPLGTSCEVTETGTGGATDHTLTVDGAPSPDGSFTFTSGETDQPTPDDPVTVELLATNTFDVGSVEVIKERVGDGVDPYGQGPFVVRLECRDPGNAAPTPITWNDDPFLDIELSAANDYRHTVDDLLVGATCEIIDETTDGGATQVTFSEPVIVPPGATSSATITVTNTFDAGHLSVVKNRAGDGVAEHGAGPFTISVTCSQTVDGAARQVAVPGGEDVVLDADNGYRADLGPFPVGAECTVIETETGGASEVTYEPTDGIVTISDAIVTVTITNRFDQSADPAWVLPKTGADGEFMRLLAAGGAMLLAAGIALLAIMRRRRQHRLS